MTAIHSPGRTSQAPLPAVILAAGQGQRLREGSAEGLKPLTPLLGLTLLERTVLSCRDADVKECYVVVGYGQDRLVPHIRDLAYRHGLRLRAIQNPHWQEGNGTSALAVAPYLHGAFLLMMCDHVFEPVILRTLIKADDHAVDNRTEGCLLAVDRRIGHIFDLDDATKVRLSGETITAIGKELAVFDAVDTGLFLCRPSLFTALEQARMSGDASLTGGMRRLIRQGRLHAVDIGNRFWIDIDTPASLAHAERVLQTCCPDVHVVPCPPQGAVHNS